MRYQNPLVGTIVIPWIGLIAGCASGPGDGDLPAGELGDCFVLAHDVPLVASPPRQHLTLVPTVEHIQAGEPLRGTLTAGTRLRLHHVREYQGQGANLSRLTFARVETGPHTGLEVATDRIGLNYGLPASPHVQRVQCP